MAARKAASTAKTPAPVAAPAAVDDVARKVWLAGVGAYGQLFTEAQGGLGKLSEKAQAAFDELVARGTVMEEMVKAQIAASEPAHTLMDIAEKVQKNSADRRAQLATRVEAVSKAVGERLAPYAAYMPGASTAKIDALAAQVATLTAEVQSLKGPKAKAPRRAAAPAAAAVKPVVTAARKAKKA